MIERNDMTNKTVLLMAGARTLRDCVQSTVEDGPKRDRRYRTFDSGIGMKANYYIYKNIDMAKRFLYLQAVASCFIRKYFV